MKNYITIKIILCLPLLFICCTSKDYNKEIIEGINTINIKENEKLIASLTENINNKIGKFSHSNLAEQINACDSISKEYINYLIVIEEEIKKNSSEIFFNGYDYSKKGKEYIAVSEKYLSEIVKYIDSNNLIDRINIIFSTKDVKSENDIYIFYLDYYFKGYPKSHSANFINNKRKAVLEIENEIIDELIIKSK